MPFKKGEIHTQGGRKTKVEEASQLIKNIKKEITNDILIELARDKVYKQIKDKGDTERIAKDFALPVVLRGIADKSEIKHEVLAKEMTDEEFDKFISTYGVNKKGDIKEVE